MMMMDVAKLQNTDDDENNNIMKDDDVVLPGFRFHPTDEELVGFYLRRKVEKKPLRIELIKQVDIYKYDPWDLPISSVGEKEWYFFCMRGRKYRNSIRPNRVTGSGFWKATGIDKPIYSNNNKHGGDHDECNIIIGLKKSLVYYRGSAGKGTKTDWMMHEFRLPPSSNSNINNNYSTIHHPPDQANKDLPEAEVWTLCRIFKRIPSYKKYTPNLKDSASQVIIRPNKTNSSSSKSCSLESDNSKPHLTFKDSSMAIHQNERKPVIGHHVIDERNNNNNNNNNHLFLGQLDHVPQAPTTLPYSNWNQDVEDLFANGNWDDLRSVVQFATDPSNVYDCRELNRF